MNVSKSDYNQLNLEIACHNRLLRRYKTKPKLARGATSWVQQNHTFLPVPGPRELAAAAESGNAQRRATAMRAAQGGSAAFREKRRQPDAFVG